MVGTQSVSPLTDQQSLLDGTNQQVWTTLSRSRRLTQEAPRLCTGEPHPHNGLANHYFDRCRILRRLRCRRRVLFFFHFHRNLAEAPFL